MTLFVDRVSEYFGGFFLILVFSILTLMSLGPPLVVAIFFAWEWNFIGEKTFKVSENVNVKEHVFQKMTKISTKPNPVNQTVIIKLEEPSQEEIENLIIFKRVNKITFKYLWSTLVEKIIGPKIKLDKVEMINSYDQFVPVDIPILTNEEANALREWNQLNELKTLIKPTLTPINERLITLEDCVVYSTTSWLCNEAIPFLKGTSSYFGVSDGNYVHDYEPSRDVYTTYEEFNWKTKWLFEKLHCREICFISTVDRLNERIDCIQRWLDALEEDDKLAALSCGNEN